MTEHELQQPDVVVVGSANVDLVVPVERLPAVAGLATTRWGAQPGMPTRREVEDAR